MSYSDETEQALNEIPQKLKEVFEFVDANQEKYISHLKHAVSIHSISCDPARRPDLFAMAHWMADKLRFIGFSVELYDIGEETFRSGSVLDLPPIVLGHLGNDPLKKTVMFFGHYDVIPAMGSGWDTDPFIMAHKGEKLYGRGVSDNKGPCIIWCMAIEAYLKVFQHLPINIKMVIDGMDECGSHGMNYLLSNNRSFFENVDYLAVSEDSWLTPKIPCISYGLRGYVCFCVDIQCSSRDVHSGTHGGVMYEAMPDVIYMLDGLVGDNGEILIPGLRDEVVPFTVDEEKLYNKIDFDVDVFKRQMGCKHLIYNTKMSLLKNVWRYPSLTFHAIEGIHSDGGVKPIIPKRVCGKFSIRIVPNQKSENVIKLVAEHLVEKWRNRNSTNTYNLHTNLNPKHWILVPTDNHNYRSAIKATQYVYRVKPQLIRSGGSNNFIRQMQEISNASVLLLPLASCDDSSHSQNENCEVRVFINGIKLVAAYLHEVSKEDPDSIKDQELKKVPVKAPVVKPKSKKKK